MERNFTITSPKSCIPSVSNATNPTSSLNVPSRSSSSPLFDPSSKRKPSEIDTSEEYSADEPRQMQLDYLESITRFLTFKELPFVLETCRQWRKEGSKLRNRSDAIKIHDRNTLDALLVCRIDAGFHRGSIHVDVSAISSPPSFGATRDLKLVGFFPEEQIDESDDAFLEVVRLGARFLVEGAANVPGLERLSFGIQGSELLDDISPADVYFPLVRVKDSLVSFSCGGNSETFGTSDEMINIVRQFPNLTSIGILDGSWMPFDLQALTMSPFPFVDLTYLNLSSTSILPNFAPHLAKLSSLQVFKPNGIYLKDMSFLGQLTNLTTVHLLDRGYSSSSPDIGILTIAIHRCTQIEEFAIEHTQMKDSEMRILLAPLLRLKHLALRSMRSLEDLSFFSLPQFSQLTQLTMSFCSELSPGKSFRWFRFLRSLARCNFIDPFNATPDERDLGMFTPGNPSFGSELWPNLTLNQIRWLEGGKLLIGVDNDPGEEDQEDEEDEDEDAEEEDQDQDG